ncbi:MAG: V-type ATP synthase subunit E [Lachnospiraceae bacterium]
MTTEEKLKRFSAAALCDAMQQSDELIENTSRAIDADYEEYKATIDEQMAIRLKSQSENTRIQFNKELADRQLEIKRKQGKKQEELKEKIIVEVRNKLAIFMDTPEYERFLVRKIKEALKFAGRDEINIYIDPNDATYLSSLQANTGAHISVSKYPFGGGMRAVIRSKNILIDNSFESRLAEAADSFTFTGGSGNGR